MNQTPDDLAASYAYCRHLSAHAGSNFHAGFLLLPRHKRQAMDVLYAFMRHTDDLADGPGDEANRCEALATWREQLAQLTSASTHLPQHSKILPALADVVRRYQIPLEHLYAVIDGVAMDLAGTRYATFEELERYCHRVASAVGLACLYIWGFRGPEAFEPARQLGVAMQLTNILRDLKPDAESGRCYLPEADLHMTGYSLEDLRAGKDNQAFRSLMGMELGHARRLYEQGAELWDHLEPDGRRILGFMFSTYRALFRKIGHRPASVLHGPVRLSRLKKLAILVRWSLLPPRKSSLLAILLAACCTGFGV